MSLAAKNSHHFSEEQRFRQLWLQLLTWGVLALTWGAALRILITHLQGRPSLTAMPLHTSDLVVVCVLLAAGALLPFILMLVRLEVSVEDEGVRIRFWPLPARLISYKCIARCYARSYHPITEYGGWGIKWLPAAGLAYNVRGHEGVQLELTNAKRVLIGSQRAEELSAAINQKLTRDRRTGMGDEAMPGTADGRCS